MIEIYDAANFEWDTNLEIEPIPIELGYELMIRPDRRNSWE
jgi:hypothetical protein